MALKTMPEPAKSTTQGLVCKMPPRIKSSPGKLEVPGKLIFARVKIKKNTEKTGIV
jgi:hypothetical protein